MKTNKNYCHEKLSKMIVDKPKDFHTKNQVNFLFINLEILSQEVKNKLVKIEEDYSLSGIINLLDQGILDELLNVEDKIIEATTVIVDKIKDNKQKRRSTIPEPTIRYTGILYITGIISKQKIERFLGYCDEFDMLVEPDNFDFENKVNWKWFKYYTPKVRDIIFGNELMKERIKPLIEKEIINSFDEELVRIYMEYCTE